ncbi:hypothetical protein CHU92_00230 [Flavobacterium cyanobacteriorum]|uniref:Uncharacterized protein n=1 Tax=Flavobacterium cyanobacteriorum TaxID=2022802 RepID=A0A256A9P1_9FLAO|nr:hypothetical protein [Flavobacterium cyanobacteriorum]OYQ49905.1 hypothetical protein CHU92_00230 [Flavobacterium cyanobacteriorum]
MGKLLILCVFCGLLCCNSIKNNPFTYKQTTKELWIDSYKYEVFYGCIKEGLGNDSLRILLRNKDLFNPNLELDIETINHARGLGAIFIEKIPQPYIKIDKGEEHLRNKNFISYNCLRYYASKELDSIANEEYRKNEKSRRKV